MSKLHTRREVLAIAGAGWAGMSAARSAAAGREGQAPPTPPSGEIRVRRTCGEKRYAAEPSIRWQRFGGTDGQLDPAEPG